MIVDGGFILRALIHDLMLSKHRERGRFISKGGLNCEFIYSISRTGCTKCPLYVWGTELNSPWMSSLLLVVTKQSTGCWGWNKTYSKSWCPGDPAPVYTAPDTSGLPLQQWWWRWLGWCFQRCACSVNQEGRLMLACQHMVCLLNTNSLKESL